MNINEAMSTLRQHNMQRSERDVGDPRVTLATDMVLAEVERLRAFVREVNGADTEGYLIYVEEQDTGYLVSDPDEAIDDLTNHNGETLELIARPRRMEV